jgi:CubicO group peptidase (beta-lactamase class C family)
MILLLAVMLVPPVSQADSSLLVRLDSVFAGVSRTTTPGCAVGVDRGGQPLVRRAYGMANLETGTPWTPQTISESGSVAKQFTAAGLVLLARDGKLHLDDDITQWIPEARGFGKRITIRHLLTHTSGIPDRYTLHEAEGRAAGEVDHTNAEVLDMVSRLRELNFDPGEDYLYSNTGYIVAAAVLERVSGQSLQQFTSARIFGPLGMTATRWREDHRTVVPGRASAYTGNLARGGWRNDHPFTRVIGSGGLLTTVGDFLTWEAALQRGDGVWGAVRDSLETLGQLNDGTGLTYGLGVSAETWRGVRRISHTGSTGGYRAVLHRYPDQQVALAILCNGGAAVPGDLGPRVAMAVLGEALAAVAAEPAPYTGSDLNPARFVGAWRAPRTEEVMVLYLRNGQLVDSLANNQGLIPIAADRLKRRGSAATIRVVAGPPVRLVEEAPHARAVEYEPAPRPALTPALRASYLGDYRSPELNAHYRVVARGDTLQLQAAAWETPVILAPLYQDGFRAGGLGILRFTRGPRNRVTGFTLWAGRVRHLRFDKTG